MNAAIGNSVLSQADYNKIREFDPSFSNFSNDELSRLLRGAVRPYMPMWHGTVCAG